jgi:hypothetical protein
MIVIRDVVPCSLVKFTDVSEVLIAFIITLIIGTVSTSETSVKSNFNTFTREVLGWYLGPETYSSEGFRGFFSPSSQILGKYCTLGHDRFLLHRFKFVIHLSSFHSTLCSLSYWKRNNNNNNIIIIIRGATALTNLGRLSSRRWQSFPTVPDGTGLTCGQHIESHSCIFSFPNRTVTSLFK